MRRTAYVVEFSTPDSARWWVYSLRGEMPSLRLATRLAAEVRLSILGTSRTRIVKVTREILPKKRKTGAKK